MWKSATTRTTSNLVASPKSHEESINLDIENGNNFWKDVINEEMNSTKMAFKFLSKDKPPPVGYIDIKCLIIADVGMNLT